MIRKIIRITLIWAAVFAGPVLAEDLPADRVKVTYALEIDGWRAISGDSFCELDKDCRIGLDADPVRLTLRLGLPGAADVLDIACPGIRGDCSFGNLSPRTFSHTRRIEDFPIFAGRRAGLSSELVMRYPPRIGRVLLHYRVYRRTDPHAANVMPTSFSLSVHSRSARSGSVAHGMTP